MGELVDFIDFFRSRERLVVPPSDGGEVLPFTGVRYSRHDVAAIEVPSPQGVMSCGRKRRKSKNRQG